MDNSDVRVVKTKRKVYEAMLLLMKDKTFEEIRVSDICEKAGINRSTFYAHFDDKYVLLDRLIKELREKLEEELKKGRSYGNLKEYYMELMRVLLEHFEREREVYASVIMNNRNSVAMDMIYDVINQDIVRRLNREYRNINGIPVEILVKFYLGAIFNVGREVVVNAGKYSKEEIMGYLDKLILVETLEK